MVELIPENVRLPRCRSAIQRRGCRVRIAEERLTEIIGRYGLAATLVTFGTIVLSWRGAGRAAVAKIPEGIYEAEDKSRATGSQRIGFRSGGGILPYRLIADFTGSPLAARGPINCARGALISACKTVFKAISPAGALERGLFRPFYELIAPDGTVFTAVRAAATGWYYEASAFATELIWKAPAPSSPSIFRRVPTCPLRLLHRRARAGPANTGCWPRRRTVVGERVRYRRRERTDRHY